MPCVYHFLTALLAASGNHKQKGTGQNRTLTKRVKPVTPEMQKLKDLLPLMLADRLKMGKRDRMDTSR